MNITSSEWYMKNGAFIREYHDENEKLFELQIIRNEDCLYHACIMVLHKNTPIMYNGAFKASVEESKEYLEKKVEEYIEIMNRRASRNV